MKKIRETQMHLALFCEEKPNGTVIRRKQEPCDFIVVNQIR